MYQLCYDVFTIKIKLLNFNNMKVSTTTRSIFFLQIFLLGSILAQGQNRQKHFSFFVCMNGIDIQGQNYLNNNHIQQVAFFNGNDLDPGNTMSLNEEALKKALIKSYPDSLASGYAILDWEGDILSNLTKDSSSAEFKRSFKEFSRAIQVAKTLRPNIKFGFYFLPFTTYWNRKGQWQQPNQQIRALLLQCDVLFPSLYVFYKEGSTAPGDNEAYATENINQILKLAKELNKPVLPFIWHRYHDSNRTIGLQLIPQNDFRSFINALLSANYKGKSIDGLVWWGADNYYYRVKSDALVTEVKASKSPDFNSYMDSLLAKYGNLVLDAMKKAK